MKVEMNVSEMATNYEKTDVAKKQQATSEKSVEKETNNKNIDINKKDVEAAVEKINNHLETTSTRIKFQIHESPYSWNNKISIKIIDEESEKVIAEIPSEESIELSERMDQIIGFLFDASK